MLDSHLPNSERMCRAHVLGAVTTIHDTTRLHFFPLEWCIYKCLNMSTSLRLRQIPTSSGLLPLIIRPRTAGTFNCRLPAVSTGNAIEYMHCVVYCSWTNHHKTQLCVSEAIFRHNVQKKGPRRNRILGYGKGFIHAPKKKIFFYVGGSSTWAKHHETTQNTKNFNKKRTARF